MSMGKEILKRHSMYWVIPLIQFSSRCGLFNFNAISTKTIYFVMLISTSQCESLFQVIGASDEQLDVFEEMMCIAALRSSRFQQGCDNVSYSLFDFA